MEPYITTDLTPAICIVDNGDYGMAFNRFTGRVLEHYGFEAAPGLVDVEEFFVTYGEYPPNEVLNTALDFGIWFFDVEKGGMHYDPPEWDFRYDFLSCNLSEALGFRIDLPSEQVRSLEVRPCRHAVDVQDGIGIPTGDIEECQPEEAEFWGVYGRTASGPAYHVLDAGNEKAAHALRILLVPILVRRPVLANPYQAALLRCEALEELRVDGDGRPEGLRG